MARTTGDDRDRDAEDVIDERFTREPGPVDRAMFYVMITLAALVGIARLTGRMDLVTANTDLMAALAGLAGLVWTSVDVRRGVTRFGHRGRWTVRRDERPVAFWALLVVYTTVFAGLLVFGAAHRLGG